MKMDKDGVAGIFDLAGEIQKLLSGNSRQKCLVALSLAMMDAKKLSDMFRLITEQDGELSILITEQDGGLSILIIPEVCPEAKHKKRKPKLLRVVK